VTTTACRPRAVESFTGSARRSSRRADADAGRGFGELAPELVVAGVADLDQVSAPAAPEVGGYASLAGEVV
jgi:hypothetical protein